MNYLPLVILLSTMPTAVLFYILMDIKIASENDEMSN
jgi:ABC-type transport system involved in cytochrome bd biosynthesis fused ATPase/permease subunit